MTTPLLTTKLYIPTPRPDLVLRSRLVERLDEGLRLGRKLTLLSAPAGFGKTTLLSDWIQNRSEGTPPLPVAWVSLEEGDSDPVRFWNYVVAALRMLPYPEEILENLGETLLTELRSPQVAAGAAVSGMETLLGELVNEIDTLPQSLVTPGISSTSGPDVVLVLDDYHVIAAQPIHEALLFLLDHLPPCMHIVIAGRAYPPFPMARLRARGQLTELHADDLRFTPDEAATFLNQTMRLGLTAHDVAALDARTEGWIAGLQLAAIALQSAGAAQSTRATQELVQTRELIATFAGEDRYVLDYLVQEVLSGQSGEVRSFLLETSILERLSGPLCDAIRLPQRSTHRERDNAHTQLPGGPSGAAVGARTTGTIESPGSQELLERLERANLFISPLDNVRQWYRYHRLFSDLLRHHLQLERGDHGVASLHRRATEWYEQNGYRDEAIHHALAAHDFSRAAQLVEQNYESAFRRNEITIFLNWFQAFPEDFIRSRPRLCIAHAWALVANVQFDAADERAQDAASALGISRDAERPTTLGTDERRMLGHIDAVHATVAGIQGNHARAVILAERALANLPPDDAFVRGIIALNLGNAYIESHDVAAASQALAEAIAASRQADSTWVTLVAMGRLGALYALQDDLHQAANIFRQAARLGREQGGRNGQPFPATSLALVYLSYILYEWNDLDVALQQAVEGIECCRRWGHIGTSVDGYLSLARVQHACGHPRQASDTLAEAQSIIDTAPARAGKAITPALSKEMAWESYRVEATRAHQWLIEGNVAAAAHWMARSAVEHRFGGQNPHLHLVQPRLLVEQGRPKEALRILEQVLARAETIVSVGLHIEILGVQACAFQALGETDKAMSALEKALSLAEPGGYVRMFVDKGAPIAALLRTAEARAIMPQYVRRLITAVEADAYAVQPKARKPGADTLLPALIEPLSEREMEVLRLIAANLSNQDIADALYVSINTVKTHVKRLYTKLDVHNRVEAIDRAQELGLLPR